MPLSYIFVCGGKKWVMRGLHFRQVLAHLLPLITASNTKDYQISLNSFAQVVMNSLALEYIRAA